MTAKTLREAIVRRADRRSYLMTDEALVCERLGEELADHGTVNHSADEYARTGGFHHTKTVESFFALLKRAIYGTSTVCARRIFTATSPNSISGTTAAASQMQNALTICCAAQRASGLCIDSLTQSPNRRRLRERTRSTSLIMC